MAITNDDAGTNVHEIADGIYRINTPVQIPGGGFSFNQYLIVDDEPLARELIRGHIQKLEDGLQFVVTIRPAACNVQEQIELGGCRPGLPVEGLGHDVCQTSTINLTRRESRCIRNFSGNCKSSCAR